MKIGFLLLDADVTGGQMIARELMLGARSAGHEPVAIAPRRGPMLDLLASDGVPVELIALERSYRLDQAIAFARLLRRGRFDLVDTHTLFVGNQLARVGALLARVPLVAHVHAHEWFSTRPLVARAQRRLEAATARSCAAVIAVSDHVRRRLLDNGYPEARVAVIHNGVALPAITAPPPGETLRVLCVARLAPSKGQETVLRALARLGEDVEVTFAGDDLERGGTYRTELEQLAEELGVAARARFLGHRSDVDELLRGSHALVLASELEGLPIVVLEAMAQARAVVATAVGGTPELVVEGETGLLVPPRDGAALAQALDRLRHEPGLRARLGASGRARVERDFTLEQMVDRTIAVYEQAS